MSQITLCIIVAILFVVLCAINKYSLGAIGMITLAALMVTGCLDAKSALSYFSNSNVILVMSMFVVSAGFNRTSLIDNMSQFVVKLTGGSFKRTFFCYIVLSAILTNFLNSPLVVFTIVLPLCAKMCDDYKVSPSKVMFPIALVCVACCNILPFGAAIQRSAIYTGYLETYGFSMGFSPLDLTKGRWPFLILVPLWSFIYGYKLAPETPVVSITEQKISKAEKQPLNKFSDWAGIVIFFGVIVVFILSGKLGVAAWQVCFVGAVLDVLCGVLDKKEAIKALPLEIAGMLVGSLALAGALTNTGACDVIGAFLSSTIGEVRNQYVLGAIFFIVPFLLTQLMQNAAVMNIFAPICLLTCKAIGANPIGLLVLVTAGARSAFMTPMATGVIPTAMGVGGYDIKSLIKQSWILSILLCITYIIYTMTVLPCF